MLALYEDLASITECEDEMQTFLMLGYLRKLIAKILTGFTDMWTVRLTPGQEDEEKPKPPTNAQKQCLENDIKELRQSAKNKANTSTTIYSTCLANTYKKVGVTPGYI